MNARTSSKTFVRTGGKHTAEDSTCLRLEGRLPMLRFDSSSSGVTALKYGTKSGFLNTSCSAQVHNHHPGPTSPGIFCACSSVVRSLAEMCFQGMPYRESRQSCRGRTSR